MAGEPTAAAEIARLIRDRLAETSGPAQCALLGTSRPDSEWTEVADEGRHWLFADVGGEYARHVTIETDGTHPVIRGYHSGRRVTVEIPWCSDNHDRDCVLAALAAIGAIPAADGMTY
jgi:hypothetical protein